MSCLKITNTRQGICYVTTPLSPSQSTQHFKSWLTNRGERIVTDAPPLFRPPGLTNKIGI